ncbi:hypothetical protein BHE74_00045126 [Ensete ventricosum]|nr:hypothetical protein BHE74_00045126 [Ensete ventricosum]
MAFRILFDLQRSYKSCEAWVASRLCPLPTMYSKCTKASWSLSSLVLDSFFPFLQLGSEKVASLGSMVMGVYAKTLEKPLLRERVGEVRQMGDEAWFASGSGWDGMKKG